MCRMCLERITVGAPRFVVHFGSRTRQIQLNEAFVLSEGTRNYKDLSFTILRASGNATTVSAQPIREDNIVNVT
jgi:hypothetical protein